MTLANSRYGLAASIVLSAFFYGASCSPERDFRPAEGDAHGGGGGAGGATPADCDQASQCDDGLACNGLERCISARGAPGADPCAALGEEGCATQCKEGDTGPSCVLTGRDVDQDQHVAAGNKCSASTKLPRDDCDDDNPHSHPNAEEVCDGIDNDCDGQADFAEGFPLGGQVLSLGALGGNGSADIAFSESAGIWAVAIPTTTGVLLGRFTAAGTQFGSFEDVVADGKAHTTTLPSIAFNGDQLGLVYFMDVSSAVQHRFARFGFSGADLAPSRRGMDVDVPTPDGTPKVELGATRDAGWGVLYPTEGGLEGQLFRMSRGAAPIPPTLSLGSVSWQPALVGVADDLIGAWWAAKYDSEDEYLGNFLVMSSWAGASLAMQVDAEVLVPGDASDLSDGTTAIAAVGEEAFIMARRRTGKVLTARRSREGTAVCGPLEIPGAPTPLSLDGEIRMTANETGAFYLTRANGVSEVFAVSVGCDANPDTPGTRTLPFGGEPVSGESYSLASGSAGHAILWFDPPNYYLRVFGNAFCDDVE